MRQPLPTSAKTQEGRRYSYLRYRISPLHVIVITHHYCADRLNPDRFGAGSFSKQAPIFVVTVANPGCNFPAGKGLTSWLIGKWCLTVSLLLSHWYPGSGVVLDCIDS